MCRLALPLVIALASAFGETVRAKFVDATMSPVDGVGLQIVNAETGADAFRGIVDAGYSTLLPAGSYLALAQAQGFRRLAMEFAVHGGDVDLGLLRLAFGGCNMLNCHSVEPSPPPPPVEVLTVCEVIARLEELAGAIAIIVGVPSADRASIAAECSIQATTGTVPWPNRISTDGLPHRISTTIGKLPDAERELKQKVRLLRRAGEKRELIAVYGVLDPIDGLKPAPCQSPCGAGIGLLPARLANPREFKRVR